MNINNLLRKYALPLQNLRSWVALKRLEKKIHNYECKDSRLNEPIFIWGLGRSGTFLLYDILSLHQDLICSRHKITQKRPYKGLWGGLHWGEDYQWITKGLGAPTDGIWRFSKIKAYDCPWIDNVGERLPNKEIKYIRKFYGLLFKQSAEGELATRLLDKYPTYMCIVDLIDQVFPDAYHIWCIRDPRATLRSMLRSQVDAFQKELNEAILFSGQIPDGFEEYFKGEFVRRHCWQVNELVIKGFSNAQFLKKRLILVNHESLCNSPKDTIDHLFKLLKLPDANDLLLKIPEKFDLFGAHKKDEFWGNHITDLFEGRSAEGKKLNELCQELGYRNEIGELDKSSTLPRYGCN